MTKATRPNTVLERSLRYADSNTTVFSDGSTFDYDNGYRSNGAPVRTRNDGPAKIVKTGGLLNRRDKEFIGESLWAIGISAFGGFIAALLAVLFICLGQTVANNAAVVEGINNSGAAVVNNKVQEEGDKDVVLVETQGNILKCDVNILSANADTEPTAHIFCVPGQPATISIPVPYDPNNPFYKAAEGRADH